jgi:hypothetical protein
MVTAENIYNWTSEQERSKEKGAWAMANPDKADAIDYARKCAKELGMIEDG